MLTNQFRRSLCANRDLIAQFKRNISKTSSSSKNETITIKKQNKNIKKWMRMNEYNNKRALSTLQTKTNPQIDDVTLGSEEEKIQFNSVFQDIVQDFARKLDGSAYERVLNDPKRRKGLTVLRAYKLLESPENLTPENIKLANLLGCSVEFFHTLIEEHSATLSKKYLKNYDAATIDYDSVNGALKNEEIIEKTLLAFVQKHFSQHPCYIPVIELFHEVTLKASIGRVCGQLFVKNNKPDLDNFTMKRYRTLVRYNNVFNTFVLPVALAMFLAQKYNWEMHRQARTVLLETGHFHQVRHDFLNVFGRDETESKNNATDIREGKCSWLSVVALQRATPDQFRIMENYYGKPNDEAVSIIKQLYEDLGLPRTFEIFEEESFKIARAHAHQISKGLPHNLFFQMIEKIYRREIDFTPN